MIEKDLNDSQLNITDIIKAGKYFSMFFPEGKKKLTYQYPELQDYPELKAVNDNELLFAWYYGCDSSPFVDIPNEVNKIQACIEVAFTTMDDAKRQKFINGDFSDSINQAIDIFKGLEISMRTRAKLMAEKTIQQFEKIVMGDEVFIDEDGNRDRKAQQEHIKTLALITKEMPFVIAQAERGFGVNLKEKDKDDNELDGHKSMMDRYFETQKT